MPSAVLVHYELINSITQVFHLYVLNIEIKILLSFAVDLGRDWVRP